MLSRKVVLLFTYLLEFANYRISTYINHFLDFLIKLKVSYLHHIITCYLHQNKIIHLHETYPLFFQFNTNIQKPQNRCFLCRTNSDYGFSSTSVRKPCQSVTCACQRRGLVPPRAGTPPASSATPARSYSWTWSTSGRRVVYIVGATTQKRWSQGVQLVMR